MSLVLLLLSGYTIALVLMTIFAVVALVFRVDTAKCVLYFVVINVLIVVTLHVLRMPIMEGRILRPMTQIFQLIYLPDDLLYPVLDEEVRVDKLNIKKIFSFNIKYEGKQSIGLFLRDYPFLSQDGVRQKQPHLKLRLRIFQDETTYFEKVLTNWLYQFDGKNGSGWIMAHFDSPGIVPARAGVSCEVEVVSTDSMFQKNYGPVRLFIRRELNH